VRLLCDRSFGRYLRAAATIVPAAVITSSVGRVSPPNDERRHPGSLVTGGLNI